MERAKKKILSIRNSMCKASAGRRNRSRTRDWKNTCVARHAETMWGKRRPPGLRLETDVPCRFAIVTTYSVSLEQPRKAGKQWGNTSKSLIF